VAGGGEQGLGVRALAALAHARAHLWITAAALVLVSPALAGRLVLDDHVLRLLSRADTGIAGLHANPLFLFSFTSGRPEDNRALMDAGALLPWWSDERHLNAFFRPLSSLTHLLDFALWPDSALLMHFQSLAWFGALLLVVAHVYRRLAPAGEPAAVAMLAFALFALDDAHGMTVAWTANRNALVAATLALPALGAHHRWLTRGWRPGAVLGPLCFALGLCAGETAVAVLGYLLAYSAVLDRAPLARRALHLLPYLVLLVAWRALFGMLGLGSAGSGAYHDPGREPLGYALALAQHLPVLLSAQLTLPLADAWFWGAAELHLAIWLFSAVAALAVLALAHVLLSHDREARFWTIGMVLSACAVAASVPGERLLLVPGVGGAALIARMIHALLPRANADAGASTVAQRTRWLRVPLGALIALHLAAAPLALPLRAASMELLGSALERADRSLPEGPAIEGQTVVVLNAPVDVMVSYVQVAREARGAARPAHLHWLATASSQIAIERIDEHTLRVQPERGFLYSAPERHYRADAAELAPGVTRTLSEMTVRIVASTHDRRPGAAEFRFREPLDSARLRFVQFSDGQFVPAALPSRGRRVSYPREDLFAILLREALGRARPPGATTP
jgi:hypothetical protein